MDPGWPIRLLRFAVVAALAYAAVVFFAQRTIAFPGRWRALPRTATDSLPSAVERLWLETSFGRAEAWWIASPSDAPAPAVLFAHGNGELIDDWVGPMTELARIGVGVLLVEYPGYGLSDGRPSRTAIRETFATAYDRLADRSDVDPARIAALGRSLGGGAAADVVDDRPVAALILLSTFSSMSAMAREMLAPGFLVRDRFDPRASVGRYDGPVLLMHGRRDEVIAFAHAERIAAARDGLAVTELDCGHNDCGSEWPRIVGTVEAFLRTARLID